MVWGLWQTCCSHVNVFPVTGEKPYKCKHCPKTFSTKDAIGKHLIAHSQERAYRCGECGKTFKRVSHVREHFKVHSSMRPYPCNKCYKTFKTLVCGWVKCNRIANSVLALQMYCIKPNSFKLISLDKFESKACTMGDN